MVQGSSNADADLAAGDIRGKTDVVPSMESLLREKEKLQERLEFVEELIGPTEAQRKALQDQFVAARTAALRAKHHGASVPTKMAGRLDERFLWASGLSERDIGLLQGGCLPNEDGILQDISVLGDPRFQPYNETTGEYRWDARGGMLQLSLWDLRERFGASIAKEVVRCARELDKYDASRRLGVELPWHHAEDRELDPAEVINILEREVYLTSMLLQASQCAGPESRESQLSCGVAAVVGSSPYAVANAPSLVRRRKATRRHGGRDRSAAASSLSPRLSANRSVHRYADEDGRLAGQSPLVLPPLGDLTPPRATGRRVSSRRCGNRAAARCLQDALENSTLHDSIDRATCF